MKRFEELLNSSDAWERKDAQKRLEKEAKAVENGEYTVKNGVLYNCIGRVAVKDVYDVLEYLGVEFDREATTKARSEETSKSIARYVERMENHVYTNEEMYEMRAAFGEGETIVDIFTGRRIRL